MASQGAVSLDTVMLNIESNAGHAVSNIDKLATSLANLKGAISGGFNNLNKLATSLENIKNASKGISGVADKLKGIGEISKYVKPLEKIGSTKNLGALADSLQKLPDVMNSITPDTLENIGRVAGELATKLKPLANEMKKIADGYRAMSNMAKNYNVRIRSILDSHRSTILSSEKTSGSLKKIGQGLKNIGVQSYKVLKVGSKLISPFTKPMTKAISKIKQMGFALLSVRSAFTFVRKAASEYLALDTQLQKAFTNTWRAMGAQLAPALEYVQYLFHQFVRVIYSVIYALTGIDLIARANEKAMKGWGKSAKDTLGNLQKFDDLHVVEFKKDTGGDNELINMDKINLTPIQKIVDWVKELKKTIEEALDTGKWKAVGEVFGSGITGAITYLNDGFNTFYKKVINFTTQIGEFVNGLFSRLDFAEIGKFITNVLTTFSDGVTNLLQTIEFDNIGKKIAEGIENIDLKKILTKAWNVVAEMFGALSDIVVNLNWEDIGKKLGEIITTLVTGIGNVIARIDWNGIGLAFHDALLNINWKDIAAALINTITEAVKGFGDLLSGIVGIDTSDWTDFEKTLNGIYGILVLISGLTIIKALKKAKDSTKDLTKAAENAGKGVKSFGRGFEALGVLGGIALVINQVTEMFKVFASESFNVNDAIATISVAFGLLITTFVALAGAVQMLDIAKTIEITLILSALALVINQIGYLFETLSNSTLDTNAAFAGMSKILTGLTVLLGVVVASALLLGSNPLYLIGVLAVVGAISLILYAMSETLPIILGAVSDFITSTAPSLQSILETIGDLIQGIIHALGDTLPPIIDSIGNYFTKVFDGISKVIETVGNTIVNILNGVAQMVDKVLSSMLKFIRELGPAIEIFVDSAIRSITRLINFIISGIEFTINLLIIDAINSLLRGLNKIPGVDFDMIPDVKIRRFTPQLETGTNEIPYEGIYHLHPGEAVVPKKYNPALGNGTNEETNQKLDTLINIMNNMSFTNVVKVGNETLYKKQQKYNKLQNNKYGTINL